MKAIYAEGETDPEATCKSSLQVRQEGDRFVRRNVRFYSLEVILAVGYRVRSARGTQFRQWATANLSEYLLKGFVLDDVRLKNPPLGNSVLPDRFGELLERIRDIRASERRMYLRVQEIFALAADYAPVLGSSSTMSIFTASLPVPVVCPGSSSRGRTRRICNLADRLLSVLPIQNSSV